jgi:hypothetical protein
VVFASASYAPAATNSQWVFQTAQDVTRLLLCSLQDKLIRSYDFTFGFCIPNSVNSWEAIYPMPDYTEQQIADLVCARCQLAAAI